MSLEDRQQFLIDTLGKSKKRSLIFADNYETISGILKTSDRHQFPEMQYEDAVQISSFLNSLPPKLKLTKEVSLIFLFQMAMTHQTLLV